MMAELMDENNVCGQNILQIVGVGNAIVAELLRLKDYIPDVFRLESKDDQNKYSEIILDFSYFKLSDVQDDKIENDTDLQDLDQEFRENYIDILTRFYLAFESIHQYITDLKNFLQELNDGIFIQQNLETVLQDHEGKQLMCESLYLYGVMLLLLDMHIPGIIRERLLVSYHRYSATKTHGESNIDDVCKLLRSTGFTNQSNSKRIPNYPEDYFRRVSIDSIFIEMIIGRLRSDDVYNQMSIYPLPEHRSTALSNQAGMLYICLFFSPQTLHQQFSRMREIVDKFFSDNWIVSIYMGITVNLVDSWDNYKAAKSALVNTVELENVKEISLREHVYLSDLLIRCSNLLQEGELNEKMLTKNISKIINLIRECNVTLRWIMLHTSSTVIDCNSNKKCKQLREYVISESNHDSLKLFELLLSTSQLELKVRDILKLLLSEKEERWNGFKKECTERINDLSLVFSGETTLNKVEKNDGLRTFFTDILNEINLLNHQKLTVSNRKIILLIQALDGVQEFHNLDSNMQVKQYLIETRQYLHQMIHTINVKEDVLINLQIIGDLSYAWYIIDNYTDIMQDGIKKQPRLVIKLRATFLKLASALEIPLLRINQAHSEDLISVSQYYSNELVNYVRKVVQIIPKTMFDILSKIIKKQTEEIKELPTRLEKDKLKEYAQLDERLLISRWTYSISVFTEGILMMKTTLVGIIELDPKQLLEDGIRKELVKKLSESLHSGISFNPKAKQPELESKLAALAKVIDGYRRSFEYVQDYINIHGLKIWQEEMSRIVNYNVEKECNSFLRSKVQDWQSSYQNPTIPIPIYMPIDSMSVNFIGRLAREILRQTDPRTTTFIDLSATWFDYKTHKEIINLRFFTKITDSIGPAGLQGLDKLYSFMIVNDLNKLMSTMQKNIFRDKMWLETLNSLTKEVTPNSSIIQNPSKFYLNYTSKCVKIWPNFLDWILKIGQKQIIRHHIAYETNISCKFNSKNLESSLRTFNEAVLVEINANSLDSSRPLPQNELLFELNKYLESAGLYNPYHTIYITTKNSHYYALFIFLFVIGHLPKLQYVKNVSSLSGRRSSDQIDGCPLIVGVMTILKQFHRDVIILFVEYMCQYALSYITLNLSSKHELGTEAQTTIYFLEIFTKFAEIPRDVLERFIPEPILNQYEFLSQKI